jgi:hypothetical protein
MPSAAFPVGRRADPIRLTRPRIGWKSRFRRVSLIPVRPDEGRLTELTAATQPGGRELVFMPPKPTSSSRGA